MYLARIFKQMPSEENNFSLAEFVGYDPATLFVRAKKYVRDMYKDFIIGRVVLTTDEDTGYVYYQWLIVHKKSVHNRAIVVVEIKELEVIK